MGSSQVPGVDDLLLDGIQPDADDDNDDRDDELDDDDCDDDYDNDDRNSLSDKAFTDNYGTSEWWLLLDPLES